MALFETLTDNFDDNSLDAGKWTNYGSNVSETSQQLQVTTTLAGDYAGIQSFTTYDLTGSSARVQVVDAGNQALTSLEVYPCLLQIDASNYITWLVAGGNIAVYKKVAGVSTSLFSTAYSSTTHTWFRIRESGGTTYWDTSDGFTWTNRHSVANPITVTTLYADLQVGTWQAEASTTTVKFDNFNLGPKNGGLTLLGVG
jgi:hypothetical protein